MEDAAFNDWEASMESLHYEAEGPAASHVPDVGLKSK